MIEFTLNDRQVVSKMTPDTPLLWVLRHEFGHTGTKYGCGIGQCGACTVHVDGAPQRACLWAVERAEGCRVTTIEGLGDHALIRAWRDAQVPQCGYCQSGHIMQAAALLRDRPRASDGEIRDAMRGNLCRCMAYPRILRAIRAVAKVQANA